MLNDRTLECIEKAKELMAGTSADSLRCATQERERLTFQSFHERPLVGVHGPAGASPMAPKIKNDHLAAINRLV
jgi:hypothetical protein